MNPQEDTFVRFGPVEARFADLIWHHEPLRSGELVALCEKELGWKKSTTYTVLKKLCDRGIFINENGTVRSLLSRGEYYARQGEQFLQDAFAGSLPAFIASFTAKNHLTEQEAEQIRRLIAACTETDDTGK